MQFKIKFLALSLSLFCSAGIYANDQHSKQLLGGKTSIKATGTNSFSMPSRSMSIMRKLDFSVGNSFFRNPWVIAPSTTDARDGLGPLFNTNGCQSCHIRDGRGHAPDGPEDSAVSMLVRLSIETPDGVVPEPTYGGQLQDFAIPGVKPEGQISVTYDLQTIKYPDGESIELRKPNLEIKDLGYGPMHPDTQFSSRIATPMIGLGLLEAIPEADILANADPEDKNQDGISGRANRVVDHTTGDENALGRFGWKAGQPNVRQQNASAFNGDLGIDSKMFPKDDCTAAQKECLAAPNGRQPVVKNGDAPVDPDAMELSEEVLDFVTFYAKNLAVPMRRDLDSKQTQKGEALFSEIGCNSCHVSQWKTGKDAEMPWLSNQTIYPYTDMLLHDMGEGLADHRPEAQASGREWRTQPLWGIGLTEIVSDKANFLHDGRARNIEEAIVWHGGEAQKSRDQFMNLSKSDREALLAFLKSL